MTDKNIHMGACPELPSPYGSATTSRRPNQTTKHRLVPWQGLKDAARKVAFR